MKSFIYNGQAVGDVAETLLANDFDVSVLRPYLGTNGRTYVNRRIGGKVVAVPVANATATLRKDDWLALDRAIVAAARPRLRLVSDLRAAGLQYVIPNGMGKTVLQTETIGDISPATVSMDGLRAGNADRPTFDLTNLPLPIVHKDFHFSARQIAASRNGGSPLDTSAAELAARMVGEEIEKMHLGVSSSFAYGGGTLAGLVNFTPALSKTLTAPTAQGWSGSTFVNEVLDMRALAAAAYHYGPFRLYHSPAWDKYLDNDFKANSDLTVRQRVAAIEGIGGVTSADHLTGYQAVLVQMTSDVIRVVVGMEITTIQWDTNGGLQKNFKVMGILVPQVRADQNANTGIVVGATAP